MPTTSPATAEEQRLTDARERRAPWRLWGPYLSERQWGTVREDYSAGGNGVGIPSARPRAIARLPLGRGRHRRHLRRPAAAVLRARAVERRRPDPQGAHVRPDRQRGQPRRGREGVLLLPRQRAEPRVHEVPVQVSAARRSRTRISCEENRRRTRPTRSTSCSTPASSTTTATSTSSSSTRRRRPSDMLDAHHARPTAAPDAAPLHLLPTLWFRNDWSWTGDADGRASASRRSATTAPCSRADAPHAGRYSLYCEPPPDAAVHRERDERRSACSARRTRRRTSRTHSTNIVVNGAPTR